MKQCVVRDRYCNRPMFNVIWTERASRSLNEITEYLRERNPQAANGFLSGIDRFNALVALMPEFAKVYPNNPRYRSRAVEPYKYRVFYRVDAVAKNVYIIEIQHGKRREPDLY